MPVPLLPSQSVPWDIAYHVAVHREAGKLPDSSPLPASSAAAMAASARTAATGRHQGPSALLTRRAGGGGGRGGGMTGGHAGTGRSSREPPGTGRGHEGLPFIHNGGGQMVGASVDAAAGSLQVQAGAGRPVSLRRGVSSGGPGVGAPLRLFTRWTNPPLPPFPRSEPRHRPLLSCALWRNQSSGGLLACSGHGGAGERHRQYLYTPRYGLDP